MPGRIEIAIDAIEAELSASQVRPHFIAQAPDLPLGLLDNRQFEVLAHQVLVADLPNQTFYDHVALLPAGADKGRDVLLYSAGQPVGAVQCKRHAANVGLTQVLREACKFAIRDQSLMPNPDGFRFELWTSQDLTDEARRFFDEPATRATAINRGVPETVEYLRGNYAGLAAEAPGLPKDQEPDRVVKILNDFEWRRANGQDIAARLQAHPAVRRRFFRSPDDGPARASVAEIDRLMDSVRTEQLASATLAGRAGAAPYIAPRDLTETLCEFLAAEQKAMVVLGGSGRGKSTWSARMLEAGVPGATIHLVPGAEIQPGQPSFVTTLAHSLSARPLQSTPANDLDQAIWSWLDAANRIVIIDGLDRASAGTPGALAEWLARTVRLTRDMPVRFIFTARPETWRAMEGRLEDLDGWIFRLSPRVAGAHESIDLPLLSDDEAGAFYQAYNLPKPTSGRRLLRTPSLVRHYAALRDQLGDTANVTRYAIFKAHVQSAVRDVVARGVVGPAALNLLLERLGALLLDAEDGRVPLAALSQGVDPRLVDELVLANLLTLPDTTTVRPEPDEVIEYLIGEHIDLGLALARHRTGRTDPLFVGGIAMAATRLEAQSPDAIRSTVADLLAMDPGGFDPDFEIAARILSDLSDHSAVTTELTKIVQLWNQANIVLAASNLAGLIEDLKLPLAQRFTLVLYLAKGEDPDDWRTKYWFGPSEGRWITPFATAATRLAREGGAALAADLLDLMDVEGIQGVVALGLLLEAAQAAPQSVLDAALSHAGEAGDRAFRNLALLHPAAAARAVDRAVRSQLLSTEGGILMLWTTFESASGSPDNIKAEPATWRAIGEVAEYLATLVEDPALKGKLLICQIRGAERRDLAKSLAEIGTDLEASDLWAAVSAAGDHSWPLLELIIEGAGGGGPNEDVLGHFHAGAVPEGLWARLLERLSLELDHRASAVGPAAALVVEQLIYASRKRSVPAGLLPMALRLASSTDPGARQPLIYVSGTPAGRPQRPAPPDHVALLSAILGRLVEAEDGKTLDTLLWKISQSAWERGDAEAHILRLRDRFGADRVRAGLREKIEPSAKQLLKLL